MQSHDHFSDAPRGFGDGGEIRLPPIPGELEYLIEPAITWGRHYQTDDAVQRLLEEADESRVETLARLAERARLHDHYDRLSEWCYDVDDEIERIVDHMWPYIPEELSEERRAELMPLINVTNAPSERVEQWIEKRLRRVAEDQDQSDVARERQQLRGELTIRANKDVHYMDIYFLFGLMDACDMPYEGNAGSGFDI